MIRLFFILLLLACIIPPLSPLFLFLALLCLAKVVGWFTIIAVVVVFYVLSHIKSKKYNQSRKSCSFKSTTFFD